MTMTDTTERVLADLDFPVPCSADAGCPRPAAWYWVCDLCGGRGPACGEHRDAVDRMAKNPIVAAMECAFCHANTMGRYHWDPVTR